MTSCRRRRATTHDETRNKPGSIMLGWMDGRVGMGGEQDSSAIGLAMTLDGQVESKGKGNNNN